MNPNIKLLTAVLRLKILRETLVPLARAGSDREVGRKCLLLAHILDENPCSQRDLAKRMGLSPGRVSQMLTVIRNEYRL